MDKKNTSIGIILLVAGIAFYVVQARRAELAAPPPQAPASAVQPAAASATGASQPAAPAPNGTPSATTTVAPVGPQADFETVTPNHAGAHITTLENSYVQVRFTDFGGAIREVAMKKYPASVADRSQPALFNDRRVDPMLGFVGWPGLDRNTRFQLVSQSATEVVYRAALDDSWDVTRRYVIAPDKGDKTDPYQLRCETTFHNRSARASAPLRVELALGTAEPVSTIESIRELATGYYTTAAEQNFTLRSALSASGGLFGLGAHGAASFIASDVPFVWATVKNQFFSAILTPDQPGAGVVTRQVRLSTTLLDADPNAYGVSGSAVFAVPAVPANGNYQLGAQFYVGPNEYTRLSNMDVFKADQDRVLQFGKMTGWASRLLLVLMTAIHRWVPNWGLAIILTTLTLKIAFLPLTLMAARSGRRMQKIQPEMAAMKEKYKDNPQKMQAATIELYKLHKVNPAGACIPMLLPLPFFFGFFYMLMSAAELRLAPFLWVHDLSAPDTVGFIYGFPIRILPLIFVVSSFGQMLITPQPQVEGSQAKMMKFMPMITLLWYYRYSCALSIYSTTNALFAIGQQLWVNSRKDDGDPAAQAKVDPKTGRPVKNITPKRK